MNNELLAYCWKVCPTPLVGESGDRYREDSLLPATAEEQLSVDETIWSELSLDDMQARFPESSLEAAYLSNRDSNDLVAAIPTAWIAGRFPQFATDDWLVAYAIESETSAYLQSLSGAGLQYRVGAQSLVLLKESGWKCLGWDVADHMLFSGLANAPFQLEEKQRLVKLFGNHLNNFGLFVDPDWARKFAEECDQRLKDHRPFFAVSIWKHPFC